MVIFSSWNIASPFPKLFCAHLCVPDCIEKIWIDLTLSLFCCCQGVFNHLSSVTNLCIFSYKHNLKKGFLVLHVGMGPFPSQPSSGHPHPAQAPPHISPCWPVTSVVSSSWTNSGSWRLLWSHRFGFQAMLTPLHPPLLCPTLNSALFSCFSIRKDLQNASQEFWRVQCPVGQCSETKGYCKAWLAAGKLGLTGTWKVNSDLNPTWDTTVPGMSFLL